MSLYALPGPLFPPVEFPGCSKKPSGDSPHLLETSSGEYRDNGQVHSFYKMANQSTKEGAIDRGNDDQERMVSVREVKLDAERLVKSLTRASSSSHKDTKVSSSLDQTSSAAQEYKCLPHEDAVEFVLSISFNGRRYHATRSMQRIFQLRKGLQEEGRNYKQWVLQKQQRRRQRSTTDKQASIVEENDDKAGGTPMLNAIPQLPSLDASCSADGIFVQGLGNLQALLKSYRPAMEEWLRVVMDIVPHDSPVLTQFLWEPLAACADHHQPTKNKKISDRQHRNNNVSKLSSIEESDRETNDDDDDDFVSSNADDQREDDETAATDASDDIHSFF